MHLKQTLRRYTGMCLLPLLLSAPALAEVGVIAGPTPIDQGMAIHADDFTIYNNRIAASFAVGSNNYWNMTNGSILDIAVVKNGRFGTDLVNDVEFLNDLWTASGSFNNENLLKVPAKNITYKTEKDRVIVTAKTRYWTSGHKLPLNVTIEYTLTDNSNYIGLKTTVENPAGNEAYRNLHSGYSISTLASSMYGPFGYYPDVKTTGIAIGADSDVKEKYGEFVVTYGKNYAVSVQLDGANAYKGSSGYKDVYIQRTIEPGQSYVYTGEILVADQGETAPIIERYLQKDPSIPAATLSGQIKDSRGKAVKNAYVIISKPGSYKETEKSHGKVAVKKDIMQPFTWKIADNNGRFQLRLPQGNYQIHVEAQGYTPSTAQQVNLKADSQLNIAVKDGARAIFNVVDGNGQPSAAKVSVSGVTSAVKTLGGTVFFTDPANSRADFSVAAPDTPVTFTLTHADGFESLPVTVTRQLKPGETLKERVAIPALIPTRSRGWYGMDNHQHSDIGDGATPIQALYQAQIAAGLAFNVVSDHDSVANNDKMAALAKQGKRLFLSSMEVSPGWGHWGILGINADKGPISANLTPAEIIKSGHDRGALVVVNHPYSDYGFFNNRDSVKGGNAQGSEDFDFLELQSTLNLSDATNMDKKALDLAMSYWNKGEEKYLTGGSDQHDVTSGLYPGIIRMYAHIDGEPTLSKYFAALKSGHTYVTMGPILTPAANSLFGSTQRVPVGGQYELNTEVQAVYGLTRVEVYSEGKVIASKTYANTTAPVNYSFTVRPAKNTWYSLVATDGKGRHAISNPIWVKIDN